MRLHIVLVLCLIFLQSEICVGHIPTEEQIAQRRIMLDHLHPLLRMINDVTVPFEQIEQKIKMVKDITKDHLLGYLESMEMITGQFQNMQFRRECPASIALVKEITAKAAFMPLEKDAWNLAEQTKALYHQLCMILFGFRLRETDESIDCDPELRQKHVDRLLELYQLIMGQIEEDYDPDLDENTPRFNVFVPPESFIGLWGSGMDFSKVEDEATREAYEKYMAEQWAKFYKYEAYRTVQDIRNHRTEDVVDFLIETYSLLPFRTTELEQMFVDRKFDPELSKAILEAVRKAENEFPDEGFCICLSTDKLWSCSRIVGLALGIRKIRHLWRVR